MDLGLRNKTALVAASSRGLGRAIAEELAREGSALALCARNSDQLSIARNEIQASTKARVIALPTDLTDADSVARLVDRTIEQLGRIDILVTNTGGPPPGPFESHTPAVWRQAIAQNLESVLNLVRAVLPGMRERRWGRILNVTSIAVKQPVAGLMLSNTIRAGVTGFARSLANEVAASGITVNNLLPGYTRTERLDQLAAAIADRENITIEQAFSRWEDEIPMARLGQPDELAALAAFLASERASYITGASIAVDGGCVRSLF